MDDKIVDFNKTVFELCSTDPNIALILEKLGFTDIVNPGVLNTVGRFMTIPKGAGFKKINLEDIKKAFASSGYSIKL